MVKEATGLGGICTSQLNRATITIRLTKKGLTKRIDIERGDYVVYGLEY
jgi:predicted transcriptional regulator of viral defense system